MSTANALVAYITKVERMYKVSVGQVDDYANMLMLDQARLSQVRHRSPELRTDFTAGAIRPHAYFEVYDAGYLVRSAWIRSTNSASRTRPLDAKGGCVAAVAGYVILIRIAATATGSATCLIPSRRVSACSAWGVNMPVNWDFA
jgi:hypothetical protein